MKSNRKLASIKQQAAGMAVLSVVFLGVGVWLWTVKMSITHVTGIIFCIWGASGMFFAIRAYLRAHRPNRLGLVDGDENQ